MLTEYSSSVEYGIIKSSLTIGKSRIFGKLNVRGKRKGFCLLGDHNSTPYNNSKINRSIGCDVEFYKRFECVLLITNWYWGGVTQFTVRQMVSEPRSWFKSRECHCEGGTVGETTIWLSTTALKMGLRAIMSNSIKNLSVFLITNWFWGEVVQLTVQHC